MKFTFFTFGKNLFWEDIYNYQDWIIQYNVRTLRYRLLDPYNIRRDSGSFDRCKNTLLKYIEACEITKPYDDTIIILHGFAHTKSSLKTLRNHLKKLPFNIIAVNYASLRRNINFHAQMISQLITNLETKGTLQIINVGTACLITRKMLSQSSNYRTYNIQRILDINPLNSGSDFADLILRNRFLNKLCGSLLKDLSSARAVSLALVPQEIDHGIIFAPSKLYCLAKKLLSRFESFPLSTPPREESYASKIKKIEKSTFSPLQDSKLLEACANFVKKGDFDELKTVDSAKSKRVRIVRKNQPANSATLKRGKKKNTNI